ncbi:hypothetical protein LNV09_10345 [Paucibacter sp. B2R-40]|uniref:TRAFAC clade GTPase domain-containing protein n=1 Tax=Paucibacter sp. B2R-40 TaxID=2893554 RepID=UPI0021E4A6A8|nr:hypothetical protein [Paucibacter sp. B2R-40]MCV2354562.1 hypothetical protein [Paucibacter sp. B2R-40]
MSHCPHKGCNAPEMSCVQGEEIEDCPAWKSRGNSGSEDEAVVATDGQTARALRFPWTGNVMGPADLPYLAGSKTVRLLTMAGASDAGKTSLLAAFYLLIARGHQPEGVEFAGSLTLEGWENIAGSLQWNALNGPTFPAHTSSGGGRSPGMLHMTLRSSSSECELVAADAPGEWFTDWAVHRDNPRADGARWLAERTDVFLVIADSKALSGPGRGQARQALLDLLRRVGSERDGRPAALVWTKCDLTVPSGIQAAIREGAARSLKDYREFSVSMQPEAGSESRDKGQGILELLAWGVSAQPSNREELVADHDCSGLLRTFGSFA